MGIYIKGLSMPRHGMVINIYPDGRVADHFDEFQETIATAIPVPPHGRLIDADVLEADDPDVCNSFMRDGYVESCEWGYSHEQIKNAPTIIPTEENK